MLANLVRLLSRSRARIAAVVGAALAAGAAFSCDSPDFALLSPLHGQVYRAELNGAGVRPNAVNTSATATFVAQLRDTTAVRDTLRDVLVSDSLTSIQLQLAVAAIDSVTAAHIHAGTETTAAGPVMVTLFASAAGTVASLNGVLNQRTITTAPSAIFSAPYNRDSLLARLRNGTAYVDIHTRRFPNGEIRGQIRESAEPFPF